MSEFLIIVAVCALCSGFCTFMGYRRGQRNKDIMRYEIDKNYEFQRYCWNHPIDGGDIEDENT